MNRMSVTSATHLPADHEAVCRSQAGPLAALEWGEMGREKVSADASERTFGTKLTVMLRLQVANATHLRVDRAAVGQSQAGLPVAPRVGREAGLQAELPRGVRVAGPMATVLMGQRREMGGGAREE